MKHLVIAGPPNKGKSKAAQDILNLFPSKYTTRFPLNVNSVFLGKFKQLPYLRAVLFDGVESQEQILELTKLIELYTVDCSIIFTTNVNCTAVGVDGRFNVINML